MITLQKSGTQELGHVCTTDTSWNDGWNCEEWHGGWSFDEWNDDWSSVGWHEGWEQTYDTAASSFSHGGFDLGDMREAALNTFPLNFGPDGAGDGRFYRTASGDWIKDGGAWQFQGYVENGLLRSLIG